MSYIFRPAKAEDIDAVFTLFEKRVNWMNEEGIRQWNVTDYLNVYPKSYYQEQQTLGNLYVLVHHTVAGAVVLFQEDARWPEKEASSAVYVHNLVTDPAERGAGKLLLTEVEKMALAHGRRYVRLDCAVDNTFLNNYYAALGYELAGECQEGAYAGNRREKKLR